MHRSTLLRHIYDLTDIEQKRKISEETVNSPFYDYLSMIGHQRADGVYHLPNSNFVIPGYPQIDHSIWAKLDRSPRQTLFRVKKATRFQQEPLAYADFIALRYVYSGQSDLYTKKKSMVLKKNDICLMNRGFVFSQNLPDENDVVFTLMFEKEFIIKNIVNRLKTDGIIAQFIIDYIMENKNPENYILFHGNTNDRIPHIFEDILCEYLDPTPYGETLLESYLQILFIEMLSCELEYSDVVHTRPSILILELLEYIDSNYMDISLDKLSQKFGYNSKYLSRLIKESTGKNFKNYVLDRRIQLARTFLINSSASIHNVMLQCGFSNETYFYKKFKEYYKMSPSEYRRAHQTKQNEIL